MTFNGRMIQDQDYCIWYAHKEVIFDSIKYTTIDIFYFNRGGK